MEILRVCIHRNELNVFHARADHVVNRIAAGSADPDDFDASKCFKFWSYFWHDRFLMNVMTNVMTIKTITEHSGFAIPLAHHCRFTQCNHLRMVQQC